MVPTSHTSDTGTRRAEMRMAGDCQAHTSRSDSGYGEHKYLYIRYSATMAANRTDTDTGLRFRDSILIMIKHI
jgi:hypothetical protein